MPTPVQTFTSPDPKPREFPLPPVLRFYLGWFVALAAVYGIMGDIYYAINRYPQCCTLCYDERPFVDFWHYHYIFRFFHSAAFFHNAERFAYPSFSAVAYAVLYHLGPHAQAIFLTSELSVYAVASVLFFRKIRRVGLRYFPAAILVLCTLLFSHPLWLMFVAGTLEIFTCVLTAAGLWAVLKGHDRWAAVLWAAAAALKVYPIILLGLFLSRARWRSLALGIAAYALISVLSMWFVGPTIPIAFAGSLSGVGGFISTYAGNARTQELRFDHSLLAPFKVVAFVMVHRTGTLSFLTKPYMLIAGTTAILCFFLRARKLPITNQLLFMLAAMVALPPVSYDYNLVHLYAPWAMLVLVALRTGAAGNTLPGLRPAFFCFAVLFTSQNYLYYHWIHPNGTFKVLALVGLIVVSLRYPFPEVALHRTTHPDYAYAAPSIIGSGKLHFN